MFSSFPTPCLTPLHSITSLLILSLNCHYDPKDIQNGVYAAPLSFALIQTDLVIKLFSSLYDMKYNWLTYSRYKSFSQTSDKHFQLTQSPSSMRVLCTKLLHNKENNQVKWITITEKCPSQKQRDWCNIHSIQCLKHWNWSAKPHCAQSFSVSDLTISSLQLPYFGSICIL